MTNRKLLEDILFELRIANYNLNGRKGNPPLKPGWRRVTLQDGTWIDCPPIGKGHVMQTTPDASS